MGLNLDQGQGVYSGRSDVVGSSQVRLCHTCIIDVMDTCVSLGLLKRGSLNVNKTSNGVNDDMPGVSNVCYSVAAGQTQNETPVENISPKAKNIVENNSSEIWQRATIDEFWELEGVEVIVDDFLIWGENHEQHDERLEKFMVKLRESGLKLNREKSLFSVSKVEFAGHVVSGNGLEPTNDHISSVLDMPEPRNKNELETFLGMVNYLGKFIPKMSKGTALLRELTLKDVAWHWDERHSSAANKLKHQFWVFMM